MNSRDIVAVAVALLSPIVGSKASNLTSRRGRMECLFMTRGQRAQI